MSTHKPVTPLPWRAHSANKASNFGGYESHIRTERGLPLIAKARGGDADTAEAAKQNAVYIAHTANAYPKLIAALSLAYANLDDKAAREEIGALLRELGE